jgi:hypothetical protein
MAPFIRYTEHAGQPGEKETFINADQIITATFYRQSGDLQILLAHMNDKIRHTLHGDEAANALAILRTL